MEPNRLTPPQIFGDQPLILERLAEVSSQQGAKFLEIGSWYGDSTLIIGEVAKRCNGLLFCVDWWKGTSGTELEQLETKEDIFALFWKRIQHAGLDDVVIPIRSRSDAAYEVLAKDTFAFIFVDGDHQYQAVLDDIRNYGGLVKPGGVLCGHDCEGYISDFDPQFLERGKNQDYYETVHCGVVLGVGHSLQEYSIDNSIWSVRALGNGRWKPTDLQIPGFIGKPQEPPPPLAEVNEHHIFRYRRKVYAVPFHLGRTDITEETLREHPEVIQADSRQSLEKVLAESVSRSPMLIEKYNDFNLVGFNKRIYGLADSLGPIDLPVDEDQLVTYQAHQQCVIADSIEQAKFRIDKLELSALRKLVAAKQAMIDELCTAVKEHMERVRSLTIELDEKSRHLRHAETTIPTLQNSLQHNEKTIDELRRDLADRAARSADLQALVSEKASEVRALQLELAKKEIQELTRHR